MAKQIKGVKGVDKLKAHHYLEYGLMRAVMGAAALLGLDRSSALGGWIGRRVGPLMPQHEVAHDNMKAGMPDLDEAALQLHLRDMWENFGRTMFEIPQLHKLLPYKDDSRTIVINGELVDEVLKEGKGALFIGAHCANWEAIAPCIRLRGYDLNGVYRAANNALVNEWTKRIRGPNSFSSLAPKGNSGAKIIVQHIRANIPVAMLIDQKMTEGLEVPFFGRTAKTPGAPAQLSLRYDCPIIPVQIRRTRGVHFEVTFHPRLAFQPTGNKSEDQIALATLRNKALEDFISEEPGQWMWMHNRWTASPRTIKRRQRRAERAAKRAKKNA